MHFLSIFDAVHLPRIAFILLAVFFTSFKSLAQGDSTVVKKDSIDYYEMSLEQLLKLKAHGVPTELEKLINSLISVASKKPLNVRESPSIVSLITEEEIKNSGARDLIDVLRLVPGLDFGVDVEGVVGLGVRGNWAHEGKVLVLLDGQETNEILFATTQFGNHYPIEQIKRIEVIRGPGSAIYGGFAEYGVINIITRQGEDLNGLSVSGTYGQGETDYLRRNANLSIGQKINDFEYSVSGMMATGQRSNEDYTDFQDSSYNMAGNSNLNNTYVNAAVKYKGLSFRVIGDMFQTTMRDGYGDKLSDGAVQDNFGSYFGELKYVLKLNDKFTITPRLNYKSQTPWQSEEYAGKAEYNRTATRALGNITASYNVNRKINVVFGAEAYQDHAVDHVDSSYFSNDEQQISYNNMAFFAQGLIKTRLVNFILGARYDKHNEYGDAFVPRVGLTKKYKRFHFKALYSNSFRAPSIENINYSTSDGIKPELTQVTEVELGYQLTRKSILTLSVFDITTNNPIVYSVDSALNDVYINSGSSGSQGIEAEYRIKQRWGNIGVNYSYYSVANKEKITDYEVSESSSSLVGFANHKFNLVSSFKIMEGLTINPTISFIGKRWGYGSVDDSAVSVIEEFDPVTLINLFLRYETPVKGLSIGIGAYDILGQKYKFIQPYDGYHAPLPGPGREFTFRLQYNLNFKKKTEN
ncbi:MAG: TonB-dependent receptor [Bacteroidetes bacterium]|jgi:outer membrane cobalamin receptor|nr:TonB-dependent receptor [Bacteroidota bacterium]